MQKDLLNPTLYKSLAMFHLDKTFVKGEGNYLWDEKGTRYLDFIAQYGAIPFGYNPAFIWDRLDEVRQKSIPSMVQPSLPIYALELANKLQEISPGDLKYATFCQSGTEAVETAIKMARSSTGKNIIVSTDKSFHGKTLGSLSATGREVYQKPFGAPVADFLKIAFNDTKALRELLQERSSEIAAFMVEPLQGEGGMILAEGTYLKEAQDICNEYGVLFIIDEIQTGLGRTGTLFACDSNGIEPDIMLLAKALGGGMFPLGACLSNSKAWNDDFGNLHSSTFANNNLGCAVGLAVIEELLKNDKELIHDVAAKGEYLLEKCQVLAQKYPDIIMEVRGQGLMLGVEFYDFEDCGSYDMSFICDQGGFTALLAGFLLNVYNIRLVPFLNNPMTLRLEPPLTISYAEIDYTMDALEAVCAILNYKDYAKLNRFVIGDYAKPDKINDYRAISQKGSASVLKKDEEVKNSFAFIIHYPGPEDVVTSNPSFESFTREELYEFLEWQSQGTDPAVVSHISAIRSKTDDLTKGWLIGIPLGAREIMSLPAQQSIDMVKKAVDLGKELGASIVGLGALTSVVTRGGRAVQDRGVAITSGNTFTTLMAVEALWEGADKMQINIETAKTAIIGATGSIGRACAIIMSDKLQNICLIGNAKHKTSSLNRLNTVCKEIMKRAQKKIQEEQYSGMSLWLHQMSKKLVLHNNEKSQQYLHSLHEEDIDYIKLQEISAYLSISCPIQISMDINSIKNCKLIIATSNSPEYLIYPEHLSPGTVICDVAKPADVHPDVILKRNDVLVVEGGLVQLPDAINFGARNLGYRDGVSLACLSETLLLALEGDFNDYSIGHKLALDELDYFKYLGEKHGLSLAGLKMGNREMTDLDIEEILINAHSMKKVENY